MEIEALKNTISESMRCEDAMLQKLQRDLSAATEEKQKENERMKSYQEQTFALRQKLKGLLGSQGAKFKCLCFFCV